MFQGKKTEGEKGSWSASANATKRKDFYRPWKKKKKGDFRIRSVRGKGEGGPYSLRYKGQRSCGENNRILIDLTEGAGPGVLRGRRKGLLQSGMRKKAL